MWACELDEIMMEGLGVGASDEMVCDAIEFKAGDCGRVDQEEVAENVDEDVIMGEAATSIEAIEDKLTGTSSWPPSV
jgi:hypothetical protein